MRAPEMRLFTIGTARNLGDIASARSRASSPTTSATRPRARTRNSCAIVMEPLP